MRLSPSSVFFSSAGQAQMLRRCGLFDPVVSVEAIRALAFKRLYRPRWQYEVHGIDCRFF